MESPTAPISLAINIALRVQEHVGGWKHKANMEKVPMDVVSMETAKMDQPSEELHSTSFDLQLQDKPESTLKRKLSAYKAEDENEDDDGVLKEIKVPKKLLTSPVSPSISTTDSDLLPPLPSPHPPPSHPAFRQYGTQDL
jgi:hypothetical protein